MPISSPPTIAPQNEPMPPTITITNVSTIHCEASCGWTA